MGAACLLSIGCQNKVHDENQALWRQNRELQDRLAQSDARLRTAPDSSQLQAMQNEIAQRDQKIKELEGQLRQPTAGSDPGIAGIETSYDAKAGTMTVNLPGDVLFDSGQATIKNSAQATLDKVAAALRKDYANKLIRVEGHTDSDPISRTKDQWTDNLDLSLTRAAAVTRYLEKAGISSKQITTSGFGPDRPKATKAKSRRVEIVVVVG